VGELRDHIRLLYRTSIDLEDMDKLLAERAATIKEEWFELTDGGHA
jgi:hypothetical protein